MSKSPSSATCCVFWCPLTQELKVLSDKEGVTMDPADEMFYFHSPSLLNHEELRSVLIFVPSI